MISTPQDFEDSIAFELYVLEKLHPAIEQHEGASIDLRDSKTGAALSVSVTEGLSDAAVDGVMNQLAPLMFGAGWKVLDLLLELALHRANLSPAYQDWSITEKQQHALKRINGVRLDLFDEG
jgi:hypothetical protein